LTTLFKNHRFGLVVMEACGPFGWINDLAVSLGLKTNPLDSGLRKHLVWLCQTESSLVPCGLLAEPVAVRR
jgi:hypothetical protein